MTKQELKDYRYTCKCIKQLESELNDAAVTDSTQGSQSEYPYVKHSVTISGLPRMEKFDKLNIEALGKIIDQFLTENKVNMLITLPKGSLDAQIQENIKLGSVVRFYIFLNCIKPIVDEFAKEAEIDKTSAEWEGIVDKYLAMIKKEIIGGDT